MVRHGTMAVDMSGGFGFRGWPRAARWATYVAAGLVVLLVALGLTAVHVVREPFPQTTGELDLPGLEHPVQVVRDSAGIPQLYGDSLDDLMRAQGYVHAQERFFEMDVRRHATAGRLAEMFGEAGVESDEMVRTMGWRRVAEQELAIVSPQTRAALEAYADGVNAYLDAHTPAQIAVQYTILNAGGLDYRPEPWTPVDSLAWLKAMAWNLRGPSFTVASACASSNHAMGQAMAMIRSGLAEVMVTGGSEAMLCFGGIKAWEGLRVMSKDGCRPFSLGRNGMVQGEGAAIFVFEEYEHARARGAEILAEVAGFSMTADASDIVMPSRLGAARAIAGAMRDAGLNPSDVGYINAHGTGTAANDKTECAAVVDAFGPDADKVMISSTKSMHGHVIGGTGAIELIAVLMALRDGVIAPTIGYEEPDPECSLDVVPNVAREARVDAVLSNAFAFGGLNAVLALTRAP